ncbi:valine--tRNA ligase, mitochondrial [Notechis scutatus]|uniref:Valine--tRNA ligase, mitochondrial n=1 Tax=Notechis scutatus TaxID=8663 RepID=A0A6J1VM53_9SAUR|nr:valine--tRNA ligase, mitochondrial [Notechis scutatus]
MPSAHLNSASHRNMSVLCRLLLWAEKRRWDGFGGWRRSYSQGSKPDLNKQVGEMDHLKNKEQRQKRLWKKMEAIEAKMAAGLKEPSNQDKTLSSKNIVEYDIPTIAGQKKDTSAPLPTSYSPRYVEAAWYPWWVKEGFFKPECQQHLPHRKPEMFSISLPPPNVTGSLHLGHALTVAIEDALVRWRRMQGYRVLWLPGSDHAGIATQAVVEKKIWKERGVLRQDLSRDEFLQEVWKWIEEKGNEIFKQLKEMGASLDWDRACFTMDSCFSQAVTEAFVQLHEQGLIYRDKRLVNWSCALQSAISDIEVENRQIERRTKLSVPGLEDKVLFGVLETLAYKVEGEESMELLVSTTRPETMFGDVAVAIHPDDSRYLAVESGSLKLMPQFYEKNWRTWLLNINDWCISRQLWWGHQIPAYRVMIPGSPELEEQKESDGLWVAGRTEAEARTKAAALLGKSEQQLELVRDADVLDTWFSSSLFPFAALGWPHKTEDLQQFFPNNLLETGSDLLFFWVARMVMLGKQLTGELPFSQVFLHSLIHDAHGRKMSKSLGNVIDPLDVIHGASLQVLQQKLKDSNLSPQELVIGSEGLLQNFPQGIAESGSDALRFALCRYDAHGTSINLDMAAMEKASHFCNKVWNALKFTSAALGEEFAPLDPEQVFPSFPMDQWILSRLYHTAEYCAQHFENYKLHSVANAISLFWVQDFCSTYLESVKPILRSGDPVRLLSTQQTLYSCVDLALRLLSPFMPFLTEELWQRLPKTHLETSPSICVARYPSPEHLRHWCNPEEEANFLLAQQIIQVIRSMKATYQLTKARPTVYLACSETAPWAAYEKYQEPLQTLSLAGSVNLLPNSEEIDLPLNCLAVKVNGHTSIYMDLQDLVDPHKELLKLTFRQQKLKQRLANLTEKLQKQNSLKAKMNHEQKISLLRSELEHVEQVFATFQKMAE